MSYFTSAIQGSQFEVPSLGFCFNFCYEGTFLFVHHSGLPPNLGTEVTYLILGVQLSAAFVRTHKQLFRVP